MYPEYLMHFGVKGMRWGVRKDRTKVSSKKRNKQWRKEGTSNLSDKELDQRLNRLRKEDEYRQRTKKQSIFDKSSLAKAVKGATVGALAAGIVAAGKKYGKKLIKKVASDQAFQAVKTAYATAGKEYLTKFLEL